MTPNDLPDTAEQPSAAAGLASPVDPPRAALLIVFVVVFIDLLGFGIVLPIMPRLAEVYLGGYTPGEKGIVIGVLFSVFSLMQFVFSPMWGRVSDRIGRRPVLLISLIGSVLFYALFGYAVSLPAEAATAALTLMFAARVGAGLAGASVGTAAAVIADCTPPERRAKGMALIGIAFGLGFTFGPLIAYFGLELFQQQQWGVGALASILSFGALVLAAVLFPETRKPGGSRSDRKFFSISQTLQVLRMPAVGPLVLIYFLAIFAFANFEATLALLTKAIFQMGDRDNFLLFAYVGAVLMVAGGIYRPISTRRPESWLMVMGVAFMLIGLIALGVTAATAHMLQSSETVKGLKLYFYLTVSIAVIGFAFVNPSVTALVSKRADPHRQGEVLGVNQGCAALGRILGPFVGSVVFQLHPSHALPYIVASGLLGLVLMVLPAAMRNTETN
jgi:DHA1 family tetracycline resistance protein-like MFS transporter